MADVINVPERQHLSRAAKAAALLADPEMQAAFAAVREALRDQMEACPIRDAEGFMALRLQLKLLGDLRANIESVMNTGKLVQHRIDELERLKRRRSA